MRLHTANTTLGASYYKVVGNSCKNLPCGGVRVIWWLLLYFTLN